MYICNDCNHVFEDVKIITEHHPYGMGSAEERFYVCPNCDSTSFNKAERCSRCGEYVEELRDGLCDICYDDMFN